MSERWSATTASIGKDAYIDAGVQVGDKVKIQNAALVYHGVTVENGVFIGPGAILTNDRFPRSIRTDGELSTEDDWTISQIVLRYGCSIGAGAIVVAGTDVGRFATVGAGAVVTKDIQPLCAGRRQSGAAARLGLRLRRTAGGPRRQAGARRPSRHGTLRSRRTSLRGGRRPVRPPTEQPEQTEQEVAAR